MRTAILILISLLSGCATGDRYLDMKNRFSKFSVDEEAVVYLEKEAKAEDEKSENVRQELDLVKKNLLYKKDAKDNNGITDNPVDKRWEDDEQAIEALSTNVAVSLLKEIAVFRNPELKAARKKLSAVLNRYTQVETLENIMAQYNAFILSANLAKKHSPGFPFPNVATLKKSIVTKEVEIAKLSVEQFQVALVAEMEMDYASLLFLDELIGIEKENLRLLKELEELVSTGYGTGKKRFDHLIRVQMEISKLSNDVVSLESKKATLVASINQYLSLPVDTIIRPAGRENRDNISYDLAYLYNKGAKKNQVLNILRQQINKSELAIRLGEEMTYPDLTQGLFETGDIKPAGKMNVWFGRNDAYLSEARERLAAMKEELEAKTDKLTFDIKKLYLELDESERDIKLYKDTLIGQAERTLEATILAYQTGNSDFIELLDTQVLWLKTNKGLIKAEKEFDHNIAKLKKLLGGSLDQESF